MTAEEKAAAITEANRLGTIILLATNRYQRAQPRQRGAYHAHRVRAQKRMDEFQLGLREKGHYLDGCLGAYMIFEMTKKQRAEFRRWKGEEDGTGD